MMLFELFTILLFIDVIAYFRIRFLLKSFYPEKYIQIFERKSSEHEINISTKFLKFSICKSQWEGVSNKKVVFWLHFNRIFSVGFYFVIISIIIYFLWMAIRLP